ncbi:MAG: hypothetical protein O3A76_14065 [Chloroflexi bacterium]|nr:hypothetical protein [Chloroflexota bacterium]
MTNRMPMDAGSSGLPIADPPQRVSGMRVPSDGWRLPGKPEGLDAAAEDAWRQTGFNLADDLRLIAEGLDIQARLAATGYTPTARNMTMAGFATLWSRALLTTADAVGLVRRGSYQSAVPLARQAVELVTAQSGLTNELDAWRRWTHEAYGRDEASRSVEQGIGHYFSGETIAADDELRVIYRAASDFGRPNFGPSALFSANEANHERYPLVFGDQAFHAGWAELLFGWLLRANAKQLHLALHLDRFFPASEELRTRAVEHVRAVETHLEGERRCRVEEYTDGDGRKHVLLVEFRRQPADQGKRLLF